MNILFGEIVKTSIPDVISWRCKDISITFLGHGSVKLYKVTQSLPLDEDGFISRKYRKYFDNLDDLDDFFDIEPNVIASEEQPKLFQDCP